MKTYEGKNYKQKEKRARVNFTQRQLEALEKVFESAQYPDVAVLEELSIRMNLPVEKICTWFQNRRSKFRKGSKSGHIEWMRSQLFTKEIQAPTPLKTKKEKVLKPSSSVLAKDATDKPDSEVQLTKIHHQPESQHTKQPLPPYHGQPMTSQNYYTAENYKANKFYDYPPYQGNGSQHYIPDHTHGYPTGLEQPPIYNSVPSDGYSINETGHLSDLQFPPGSDFVLPVTTAPQTLGTTAYTPTTAICTLPQSGIAYDTKLNNVCSTMSSSYPPVSVEYIPSLTTMNSTSHSTMVTPSYNSYSSYQGTISSGVNFSHLNPASFGADSAYAYNGTPGVSSAHQSQYGNYGQFSCGSNTYQPPENFNVNQLPQNTQLTSL